MEDQQQQREENNSSAPSNELEIIEAEPLAMIFPNIKPRRGKRSKEDFKDGTNIGLPEGWVYEERPRTNANYIGKIDQFFYEPGTYKQFRSLKSVEKYLASKRQKLNQNTPEASQGIADMPMIGAPAAVVPFDLSNADSEIPNPNPNQESSKNASKMKKTKNVSRQKARPRNLHFNFKEAPDEVTWVLSDAKNDKWTAFMGDLKVQNEVEQYWADTFKIINGGNDEHDDDN